MDVSFLKTISTRYSKIITIEEGTINGGFGDGVASWLLENNFNGSLKRIGLPDSFVEHGTRNQILSQLGLDAEGLSVTIKEMVPLKETLNYHS